MGFEKEWRVLLPNLIDRVKRIVIIMQFTENQLEKLKPSTLENYLSELVSYYNEKLPHLQKTLGNEGLRDILRQSVDKARESGFTERGPIRFYIDMLIALGWGVETDPQYPWVEENLHKTRSLSQIERSIELHHQLGNYLNIISGDKSEHIFPVAQRLECLNIDTIEINRKSYINDVDGLLHTIFPQKYSYMAKDDRFLLIQEGTKRAYNSYGFESAHHSALIVVMMFLLGHQFDIDPFYQWANINKTKAYGGGTLATDKNDFIAKKLEKRAKIWLKESIKREQELVANSVQEKN